jgi:hypothetical protein
VVATLVITSGLLYAGVSAYRRLPRMQFQHRWETLRQRFIAKPSPVVKGTVQPAPVVDCVTATTTEEVDLNRNLASASFSLGCATVGALLYPPAHYLCIPTLVYMAVPVAKDAYTEWMEEQRIGGSAAETTLLVVCLVQGAYFVGSLGFSLYYLGRKWSHAQRTKKALSSAQIPAARFCVQRDGLALELPIDQMQAGDLVIIGAGEIPPNNGIIMQGIAWVSPYGTSDMTTAFVKKTGCPIYRTDLVLAGRIGILMQQPATEL